MEKTTHGWAHVLASSIATIAAISQAAIAAPPVAGEIYTYRLINGYSNEVQGQVVYRVDRVDADRISLSVTPDTPNAGTARTEIYTKDGNWVRHPIVNRDQHVVYDFPAVYPAYVFPLERNKSWSVRVDATSPATGRRSVRVDGEVLGAERIRVPAGEFDTIKVRRSVYAGDSDGNYQETKISEIDWYAPALGRPVRTESSSTYLDKTLSGRFQGGTLGDRHIYELVSVSAPARQGLAE